MEDLGEPVLRRPYTMLVSCCRKRKHNICFGHSFYYERYLFRSSTSHLSHGKMVVEEHFSF